MCLACVEFILGNLKVEDFRNNLEEYRDEEHDPKALEKAGIKPEDLKKED